jgi:hydrogenase nickel incorporation protein HypB
MSVRTIVNVRERVMARNDEIAATVRARLADAGIPALNLLSSPGAGKTALLEATLQRLGDSLRIAILTGDVQTQNDADRLAKHTDRLVQAVVTGGACHLDASQVLDGLAAVDLADTDLVIVENVGNLVCPSHWDLGEDAKVVVMSTTEGEDKPLKYPAAFQRASAVVLNKIDLLPHVPYDADLALRNALAVNPALQLFRTSARTGEGLDAWCTWLRSLPASRVDHRLEASAG